ncbi:MAG TPA: hypothetical protein VFP63_05535 [Dehalococcoidia bacterium]|nr:hypothetical protein [Dehalococcoidia bacterium]
MRCARLLPGLTWTALAFSLVMAAAACGGDDDAPETTPTDVPTATPFSLGTTLSIHGQDITLPEGVAFINQTADCQAEGNASSPTCLNDLKMLVRGSSYILFDATIPRVISRRIEPEDESDFRQLLDAITGTADSASPDQSPGT